MALRLSKRGYDVVILDNLSRRDIDKKLGTASLSAIAEPDVRIARWREMTGRQIRFIKLDLAEDFQGLCTVLDDIAPQTIIHFGEQRSAPFSMLSPQDRCYTVSNNLRATHNLLAAMVQTQSEAHLVHLGSIGVYGYESAGIRLPEGYLRITMEDAENNSIERDVLYPTNPDSIYHMTKAQDQLLFAFYARNDKLRITDMHQGIVWGTQTAETILHAELINRFDHDAIYGTVVNRFLVQAATGQPLTVYGSGGQTRGFIHIEDMLRCLLLAVSDPPSRGERVRIFNEVGETVSIQELALLIASISDSQVTHLPNPRNEPAENTLKVDRQQLIAMGFKATLLVDGVGSEYATVKRIVASGMNQPAF
jgi:UDP-sulfoquinovose synthase